MNTNKTLLILTAGIIGFQAILSPVAWSKEDGNKYPSRGMPDSTEDTGTRSNTKTLFSFLRQWKGNGKDDGYTPPNNGGPDNSFGGGSRWLSDNDLRLL